MIIDTLTSPIILFFVLGMLAGFARSDLSIPEAVAKGLAIYLMAAIGLKGGVSVAENGFTPDLGTAAAVGIALSFLLPLPAFYLLRGFGRLDQVNAGAVAAHYGSVSLVTYITAIELLKGSGLVAPGFMAAVLALMETPAIITGLALARRGRAQQATEPGSGLLHEVFLNGSVVLLIGSFLIGLVAGKENFAPISPVFEAGYRGVLCLFLLDMGLLASRRLAGTRALTLRLGSLAVLLPLVNGSIGVALGTAFGLEVATAATLGILAASASYIAVPAAMRLALPEADPGIYLSMSLGITFPFNVIIGIPLFASLATLLG
uniref:sodium-dependent bicarbonate transport family permease n=1 Tax=uncultured Sphingomonas sp. TaxID=158754 RepID=UPI0025D48BC6|nr:sodium-dependent bicarbonate transport family permease [uncultured Sphingomonas sp.]